MCDSRISGKVLQKITCSLTERHCTFRRLLVKESAYCLLITVYHQEVIYTRFIRLAANPAPKPLSILTTVTPAAQELSIPNKAASPLKLAP